MGLRKRLDGFADRVASAIASLFVTAPDHPSRGGLTGRGEGRSGDNPRDVDSTDTDREENS